MGRNIIIEMYIPLYVWLYYAGILISALLWVSIRMFVI